MSLPEDNLTIRFTAKELFARIDQKLDVVVAEIGTKADVKDLHDLEIRVEVLEKSQTERRAVSGWVKAAVVLMIPIAGLAITAIVAFWP